MLSSILFVCAAGEDELSGVRLKVESAFLPLWMWFSGGGKSLEHLGCGGISVQLQLVGRNSRGPC